MAVRLPSVTPVETPHEGVRQPPQTPVAAPRTSQTTLPVTPGANTVGAPAPRPIAASANITGAPTGATTTRAPNPDTQQEATPATEQQLPPTKRLKPKITKIQEIFVGNLEDNVTERDIFATIRESDIDIDDEAIKVEEIPIRNQGKGKAFKVTVPQSKYLEICRVIERINESIKVESYRPKKPHTAMHGNRGQPFRNYNRQQHSQGQHRHPHNWNNQGPHGRGYQQPPGPNYNENFQGQQQDHFRRDDRYNEQRSQYDPYYTQSDRDQRPEYYHREHQYGRPHYLY